ncbi:MAG: acyl-CoA dehydrogenase family protein, partial [Dehalococcoidia bacterium]|nr:acyl-CoA dehydrogenase family protein [Dehalococcoidia bacterium]
MDFNLSEEQQMLRTGARDFLTAEWTGAMVRELEDKTGHSPGLWRKMADLGWVGLALPVEYGGSGASFLELTILLEEMGRALVPSSFFSTVVLGALTILNLGNEEQRLCFLPPIARGEQLWTLALGEPPEGEFDHIRTVARGNGKTRLVNGTKTFVPDADVANYLICVAGTSEEGGRVFPVIDRTSMGLMVTWLPTMAGDRQFEVILGRVAVTGDSLLGGERTTADVERLVQQAAVAKSAEMVGGCQRA